jgi:small subunit ribosomal protein S5
MSTAPRNFVEEKKSQLEDKVVSVNRCAKVVKGGRNFSFSALVVVGDKKSQVGIGLGKANEVADAIRKGGELARKSLVKIPLNNSTITHSIEAAYGGGKVLMKPAAPGTGLIAGGGMRAVLELAGIKDVVAKSLGSSNAINVVKATMKALQALSTKEEILAKRA